MREIIPLCRSIFFAWMRVCIPLLALLHPLQSEAQQIAITEIMVAPRSGEAEWIEILNLSPATVDMRHISLHDATGHRLPVSDDARLLEPGARLVITEQWPPGDRWDVPRDSVIVPDRLPSLNNGGDAIVLRNAGGAVLDSVQYEGSWLGARGISLERIHVDRPPVRNNWAPCANPDGATPGGINSVAPPPFDLRLADGRASVDSVVLRIENCGTGQPAAVEVELLLTASGQPAQLLLRHACPAPAPACHIDAACMLPPVSPGRHMLLAVLVCPEDMRAVNDSLRFTIEIPLRRRALLINEIMFEPTGESCEWIEFVNVSREPVDMSGFALAGTPGYSGKRPRFDLPEDIPPIAAGGYAVVAADSGVLTRFPDAAENRAGQVLITLGRSTLGLGNSEDDILLLDYDDRVIDSLHYSENAHHPFLAARDGCSLELIHPSLRDRGMDAWGSCTDPLGGTPGRRNSIYSDLPPDEREGEMRIAVSPLPFSPDGDGFEDYCIISCAIPSAVNQVRLRLYDVNGRLVRTLRSNTPSGRRMDVIWDGLDENGRRARIGPYVALLEVLDVADNTVSAAKGIVVVAVRL